MCANLLESLHYILNLWSPLITRQPLESHVCEVIESRHLRPCLRVSTMFCAHRVRGIGLYIYRILPPEVVVSVAPQVDDPINQWAVLAGTSA